MIKEDNYSILTYTDSPFSSISIREEAIEEIIRIAEIKCNEKSPTNIARKMNIELRTWKNLSQNKNLKVHVLERISNFCDIDSDFIIKNIEEIDNIREPNIPINFDTKEGVRLDVGVINEGRVRNRIVEYHNKDREIIEILKTASKKVIGEFFVPKERMDKRSETNCLYFPAFIAKHFIKLVKGNKSQNEIKIPDYILNNENFQKIWWKGNLSEEASLYPSIGFNKNEFFISPKIQINRVKRVDIKILNPKTEKTYYKYELSRENLDKLKKDNIRLIEDEVKILSKFDINTSSHFSKLYINKEFEQTATHSIYIYRLKDLELYNNEIGFELNKHKKQFDLLMNNRGGQTRESVRDTFIKFYEFIPQYLRTNKKIKSNKFLNEEDKRELLGIKKC
ncbi:MAG: hypothetical protein AABX19_01215 [Nanoarchaeota archaeon]